MTAAADATAISGLSDIAERYDAFLVDQFGVLHDGTAPYAASVETLERLIQAGKRVLVLSNSGKRSAPNLRRLERLGFPRGLWTHFLSSGEVAWSILAAQPVAGGARRRCLLLARDGDYSAIEGLPFEVADSGGDCDIVVIAGSESDVRSLEDYRALLTPAAERGVPAYCTNPDMQMLTRHGLRFGAGRIGALYEELGGSVTWIGKPFPAIYAAALLLVADVEPARVLCVGDSVDHDIAGASRASLNSCLVTGGIHAGLNGAELSALFAQAGATPNFVAGRLCW